MARPTRVGVLTFHRCINYGSYWQARRLVEGLRARGCEAILLDHRSRRVDRAEWRCALSPHLPAATSLAERRLYARKARAFFQAFEALPRSEPFLLEEPTGLGRHDLVVVGSDEVWNLRHPWFGGVPLFFGEAIEADRVSAYAASAGNHDGLALQASLSDALKRFAHVSVRDENARRLVREVRGEDPVRVLDPCLQFAPQTPPRPLGSDVVIYGHDVPPWLQRRVKTWARKRGLRLVSLGYRNAWADVQDLAAGPDVFAEAMAGAAAVVTTFFHGCVFALANHRPFLTAATAYRADKVRDLLGAVGDEGRFVDETTPPEVLAHLLQSRPGAAVQSRLDRLRDRSDAFLEAMLG